MWLASIAVIVIVWGVRALHIVIVAVVVSQLYEEFRCAAAIVGYVFSCIVYQAATNSLFKVQFRKDG